MVTSPAAPADYVPPAWLAGGHRMTIYTWARPRQFPRLPAPEARLFRVAPDTEVLAHCHWQPDRRAHPVLVALHGLEGSSDAHYMRGLAEKAWVSGFNVVRLNQRNCGGTEHLTPGLYHSGLTADPVAVLRELVERDGMRSIAVAGYSLGGNLALKLAGEAGDQAPPELRSVAAVSPTLDLGACIRMLERPENRMYEWYFLFSLKQRMRRKQRLYPGRYALDGLARIRSVRAFDDRITAPHHGFRDAADYYHRASAMRDVDRVRVPALIVSAEDDPFVPAAPLRHPAITGNPRIAAIVTRRGGHCGYLCRPRPGFDGYWAEARLVQFALEHA